MQSNVVNLDESPPDSPPDTPPARASTSSGPRTVARIDLKRPPVRDFALAAFQREEDLPRLVAALEEHDNQPRTFRLMYPGQRITEISLRRIASEPGLAHVRSEAGDSDVTIKAKKREDADEADSASSTERDEPGRSLARKSPALGVEGARLAADGDLAGGHEGEKGLEQAKKKNKKKNKKKKKKSAGSESKKDEAEVEELLDKEAVKGTNELDRADADAAGPEGEVDIELGGQPDPIPRSLDPVEEQDEGSDETAQEDPDAGDVSSSTIDNTLLVTPHIGSEALPPFGELDAVIGISEVHASEGKPTTEVIVRIPSPSGSSTHGISGPAAENSAQRGGGGLASGQETKDEVEEEAEGDSEGRAEEDVEKEVEGEDADERADQRQPTMDPTTVTQRPTAEETLQGPTERLKVHHSSPLLEPIQPVFIDVDGVPLPLGRSWTLYHSMTGASTQSPTPSILHGLLGPSPPLGRQAAEDYSHGLFKLFTARTIQDLFGTWKALRRKIAVRRGRYIEPMEDPPLPGLRGLGIAHLPDDTNFHFFLEHVKPMWEDEVCKRGGKIMITGNADDMDTLFFELVLILAGEQFHAAAPTPPNMSCTVVGAVLSKRRSTCRIEVWVGGREPLDAEWVRQVEKHVRDSFPGQNIFEYKAFHSSARPMRPRREQNGHRSVSTGSSAFGRGLGNVIGPNGR